MNVFIIFWKSVFRELSPLGMGAAVIAALMAID